MYNIAVVISTYNGGKYFAEQLRSILNQNGVKVYVYVRDDGSTDKLFVEQLCKLKDLPNIDVCFGENLGVGASFFECLKLVPEVYDFYAFSDQDDVWLEDKLLQAVRKLEHFEGNVLYASNQYVVDESLANRHYRFSDCPGIRYGDIIRGNKISGCTFVFNRYLFRLLVERENWPSYELLKVRIHDVWIAVIASLFGKIVFDNNAYILYRQHGSNVVGAQEYSLLAKIKIKLSYLTKAQNGAPLLCKELNRIFSNRLGEYYEPINCFAVYQNSFNNKLKLLKYYRCFKHADECKIVFLIKTFLEIL